MAERPLGIQIDRRVNAFPTKGWIETVSHFDSLVTSPEESGVLRTGAAGW